jgi:hypothetical protein
MKNTHQGKRQDQITASEIIAGICFIGTILTFIYLLIIK